MPFSFDGVEFVASANVSRIALTQILVRALESEGSELVEGIGNQLTFRGVEKLSMSPLQSITKGTIRLDDRPNEIVVSYYIQLDRFGFLLSLVLLFFPSALFAVGIYQFKLFAICGAALLIALTLYSFVIRMRFIRWLKRLVQPEE